MLILHSQLEFCIFGSLFSVEILHFLLNSGSPSSTCTWTPFWAPSKEQETEPVRCRLRPRRKTRSPSVLGSGEGRRNRALSVGGNRTGAWYSARFADVSLFYNSSSYWDEFIWGGAWLYYVTGNISYLQLASMPGLAKHAGAFWGGPDYGVLSWDNKLTGAQVR